MLIADRDHIFFENGRVVPEMLRDFSGYLQADARSVYDTLFRPPEVALPDGDERVCREVGCWSHCRRKFWVSRP